MAASRFFALVLLSGCSLIVDSSLEKLKCESKDSDCRSGFSCRFDECVSDKSVKESDTCSDSKQCSEGLFCPPGIPLCSRPCTKIYALDSECGADHVCVPVADRDNAGKFTGGACVPTECSGADADAYCRTTDGLFTTANGANGCIKLAPNGGLCLLRCLIGIRKANSSKGVDLCISDRRANPTHCGRVAAGDLICVPAGNLLVNQECTLFPQSTSQPPDACGLNVVNNTPGLPFLCLDKDGGVTGKLRCRVGACERNDQCPTNQTCVTQNGLQFCRGASED